MSREYKTSLTHKQIVDCINIEASGIAQYNQYETYDNGYILGHQIFSFFSSGNEQYHGTVVGARLEENPNKIFVIIKQYKKPIIELCIHKKRAIRILCMLRQTRKYINFIIERFQASQEKSEEFYKKDIACRIEQHGVQTVYATELMDISVCLEKLLAEKIKNKTDTCDAQIQNLKWRLRILEEMYRQ